MAERDPHPASVLRPAGMRALWCYGLGEMSMDDLTRFGRRTREDLGITDLLVSLSGRLSPGAMDDPGHPLARMIQALQPLRVHGMILEDPAFLEPAHQAGVGRLVATLSQAAQDARAAGLAGLHLDVEPHASRRWSAPQATDETRRRLFEEYVAMLANVRANLASTGAETGFQLTAAIGWWWEHRPEASLAVLGEHLDAAMVMAYNTPESPVGGSAERLLGRLPFEDWAARCPAGTRFVIGIGIREHPSIAAAVEEAEKLEVHARSAWPNTFGGTALFSNLALERP